MILLETCLNDQDQEHLRRILSPGDSSTVLQFLRRDVYLSTGSVDAFKGLKQAERERTLSDLVWRITCHLDNSVTSVQGTRKYSLGSRFSVRPGERGGRSVFCILIK